jgi:C-terminal processing protease CtpA/Prc
MGSFTIACNLILAQATVPPVPGANNLDGAAQQATGALEQEKANQPGRSATEVQRQSPETRGQGRVDQPRAQQERSNQGARSEQQNVRGDSTEQRGGAQPSGEADQRRGAGQQARLGIQFDQRTDNGLIVTDIEEGSVAARAGLRARDRIVSVEGRTITNPRQLQAYIRGQGGRAVPVIIDRDGQRYTIQLASQGGGEGAWLGVYLQDGENDRPGAQVTSIYPSGPAARAGLRTGDVILALNGQRIANTPDLIAAVDGLKAGSRAEATVLRNGQEMAIPIVLGSRESFVFYPRNEGGYSQDYNDEDSEYINVPPFAMQLEHDRRMAEQHQRIESELRALKDEVRQLREALGQKRESPR